MVFSYPDLLVDHDPDDKIPIRAVFDGKHVLICNSLYLGIFNTTSDVGNVETEFDIYYVKTITLKFARFLK